MPINSSFTTKAQVETIVQEHTEAATEADIKDLFGTRYSITANVTNGTTASGSDIYIWENRTATVTISANYGFILPDSITVSGATCTYNKYDGVISLSNPTENVTLNVICEAQAPTGDLSAFVDGPNNNYTGFEFLPDSVNGATSPYLEEWLSSLDYDDGSFSGIDQELLLQISSVPGLAAYRMQYEGDTVYFLLGLISESHMTTVYSTKAFTVSDFGPEPITATEGWQNITDHKLIDSSYTFTQNVVVYNESNWNGRLVGKWPHGSAPTSLTPFELGDTIDTGDYAVFDTSISDSDMLSYCQGLTYDGEGLCVLVGDGDAGTVVAVNIGDFYAFMVGGGTAQTAGWASSDIMTGAAGWQGLDQNGKVQFVSDCGTIAVINPTSGWNGVIVGIEKGSSPSSLTPFELGQTTYGYYANGDMTASQVNPILTQLDYTAVYSDPDSMFNGLHYCPLVTANQQEIAGVFKDVIGMSSDPMPYVIAFGGSYDSILYISDEIVNPEDPAQVMPAGWLFEAMGMPGGITLLEDSSTFTISSLGSDANLWNGILVGANTTAPVQGLTPFAVNDSFSQILFNDSLSDNAIASIVSDAVEQAGQDQVATLSANAQGEGAVDAVIAGRVEGTSGYEFLACCSQTLIIWANNAFDSYIQGWQPSFTQYGFSWDLANKTMTFPVSGEVTQFNSDQNGTIYGKPNNN